MAKKIIFLDGSFQSIKSTPHDNAVVSDIKVHGRFDQVLADALGIKDSLYKDGHLREGLRSWGLEVEMFGPNITIVPQSQQKEMFKETGALEFRCIKLHGASLKRLKDDGALRIHFTITLLSTSETQQDIQNAINYLIALRKSDIKITATPASKEIEAHAQDDALNYGLFKRDEEEDLAAAASGDDGEDEDPVDEEDGEEMPEEGEPEDLRGAALASWRQMNMKTRPLSRTNGVDAETGGANAR